jgi:hypothetical protein
MTYSYSTSLSVSDIIDIRRGASRGVPASELALDYDVGTRYIYKILKGEKRSSVPFPKTIKGFKNYEITADGRVWSKTKNQYLSITSGKVRLTRINGIKQNLLIRDLMKKYF